MPPNGQSSGLTLTPLEARVLLTLASASAEDIDEYGFTYAEKRAAERALDKLHSHLLHRERDSDAA